MRVAAKQAKKQRYGFTPVAMQAVLALLVVVRTACKCSCSRHKLAKSLAIPVANNRGFKSLSMLLTVQT
jgi:hypothetical protein